MRACYFFVALLLSACMTDEPNTVRTLRASGFTDIQITGYAWFECGEHDTFHTGFRAKNVQGQIVERTVCCGWLTKGCTVRF